MAGKEIVRMEHITKVFPGVKALDDVSFTLHEGEVHALMGENGAGKSTLMKILSGVYTKTAGKIFINGEEVEIKDTNDAGQLGIAIIHQELNMAEHLTVMENIFLGREIVKHGLLQKKAMRQKTKEYLQYLNVDLSPDQIVGQLTVSKQQMVEICKALSTNAKVLIMDEPTSALSEEEVGDLFKVIRQLRDQGHGIVYISHRMDEMKQIVDRVTVMRDGEYILSSDLKDISMADMIKAMVGREIKEQYPRIAPLPGKPLLEVTHVSQGKRLHDISFSVSTGEIVGIAGLVGAGRSEMVRTIFGADPRDSGEIVLDGKQLAIHNPGDAIRDGIVLVPEDRKRDGLAVNLSVADNIKLANLDILSDKVGIVNEKKSAAMVKKAIHDLSIKVSRPSVMARTLSGGNQQKVVVGKWLARTSKLVIFDEPTRGIDIAAKVEIYELMNNLKRQGIGVIFISSELPEVLGMADRILVMSEGRLIGELTHDEATQDKIMSLATAQ